MWRVERRPAELRTKVFGERTIYDNRWVRLNLVDIEPPDGRRFEYHVVRLARRSAVDRAAYRF